MTLFCRLDEAENHRAALCALRRVGKQEVLAVNDKRFYAALCAVVRVLQPPVQQITFQIRPLFTQIIERFSQRGLGRYILSRISPCV